jgi:hypothetical protein
MTRRKKIAQLQITPKCIITPTAEISHLPCALTGQETPYGGTGVARVSAVQHKDKYRKSIEFGQPV